MYSDVCCQKDGVYDDIEQKTDRYTTRSPYEKIQLPQIRKHFVAVGSSFFVLIISSSLLSINVLDHNDKLHCH